MSLRRTTFREKKILFTIAFLLDFQWKINTKAFYWRSSTLLGVEISFARMIYKLQTCWEVNKIIIISVQFLSKSFHFFRAAMFAVNGVFGEKQFASNDQMRLNGII